jgi:3-deoxy-manno-octulosonate cytidylyltransferase (CMP-KDO synthetase)
MLCHVWDRVAQAKQIDGAVVATDDERIADLCVAEGYDVEMTSSAHQTGTDRLAEVASKREASVYVNAQGDEPLLDPTSIDAAVDRLEAVRPRGIEVVTGLVEGATAEQEASLSVVHVERDLLGDVMTFSRLPVPAAFRDEPRRLVQLGLYAFTRPALLRFGGWQPGPIELAESVELLRFLEHGERVATVAIGAGSIAVDHPEDVARVEAVLSRSGDRQGS